MPIKGVIWKKKKRYGRKLGVGSQEIRGNTLVAGWRMHWWNVCSRKTLNGKKPERERKRGKYLGELPRRL